MDPTAIASALSQPEALIPFVTGATALIKKLGVSGEYLTLAAFVIGGGSVYLSMFQPSIWASAPVILTVIASIASGNVALLKELVPSFATGGK